MYPAPRRRRPSERVRLLAGACLLAALPPLPAAADTVASVLGNFSTNQFAALAVGTTELRVRYALVLGQLPALRELHAADTDGDGVTTDAERKAYAQRLAASIGHALVVTIDGERVTLRAVQADASLPPEQAGFSLRVDVALVAPLPAGSGRRDVTFANRNHDGRFGWQEIVVEPAPGIAIFATDAFADSLTHGLTEAVQDLPPGGPLAERDVRFSYREGTLPAGETALAMRSGAPWSPPTAADAAAAGTALRGNDSGPDLVQGATRGIVDLIAAPTLAPHVAVLAWLAALLLGALHAFSPGHGKTVVGAYLIGSRANARHAAFLGLTVTVTHTLGVFALGFATLFASAWIVPETLLPILGMVSGLVIVAMGGTLAWQRWPAAREAWRARTRRRAGSLAFRTLATSAPLGLGHPMLTALHGGAGLRPHGVAHPVAGRANAVAGHAHRDASHPDAHAHDNGWHSHGGTWHTHLPPGASGETVSWRSLLALGVSGGLVPCPSAMVLMLAAIAMGKTALGLGLVVAFSAGLALALTGVGLAFLHARNRLPRGMRTPAWVRVLPFASAVAIAVLGIALCYGALV